MTAATDVNAFLGAYPNGRFPVGTPENLLDAMDRTGIGTAWVSHLDGVFGTDPAAANADLFRVTRAAGRLRPVPAIHPGRPWWRAELHAVKAGGAPAVRCDPTFRDLDPVGGEMREAASACAEAGLPLVLTVRLEDVRQQRPDDRAPELEPWAVRGLLRAEPHVRLIVTHADRDFVEQVHFGSTAAEAARVLWDICWIWGPPEDHLATLLATVGLDRFTFGTGMPLRLPEATVAKLDLLDVNAAARAAIEAGNLSRFLGQP